MLTFRLVGRCQGCNAERRGFQFAFPKRINLGSIVTERSLYMFDPCGCDRNHPREVLVVEARLTEESAAVVEKARQRIRARRKKKAA